MDSIVDELYKEEFSKEKLTNYLKNNNLSLSQFCNNIAIFIANKYLIDGSDDSWELCDLAINSLSAYIFKIGENEDLPEPAWSIYLAFDNGEFYHDCDDHNTNPITKYTIPSLKKILKR